MKTSNFQLFSISEQKANLFIREKFILNDIEIREFLLQLKSELNIHEAMIISNCSRTEIYYCDAKNKSIEILEMLCNYKKQLPYYEYVTYFDEKNGQEVIKHFFCTGIGVHSKLSDDNQLLFSLNKAFTIAEECQMSSINLKYMKEQFLRFDARILKETHLKENSISKAKVVAKLIQKESIKGKAKKILIIGLGHLGTEICEYLNDYNTQNIWVTNRTMKKAKEISKQYGFQCMHYSFHSKNLHYFDIVISCAQLDKITYHSTHFSRKTPNLIMDLCVPRTVSADVVRLGTKLINVDDLSFQTSNSIMKRKQELNNVLPILTEELLSINSADALSA